MNILAPQIVEDHSEEARPSYLAKVHGRFVYEGAQSKNRRTYINVKEWCSDADKRINKGEILDMRTHHETDGDVTAIVGRITKVYEDGQYDAIIAPTDAGRVTLQLLKGGFLKTVSLRGGMPTKARFYDENESPDKRPGWAEINYTTLRGIDYTNTPGLEKTSASLFESDVEQFIESFSLSLEENKVPNDIEGVLEGAVKEGANNAATTPVEGATGAGVSPAASATDGGSTPTVEGALDAAVKEAGEKKNALENRVVALESGISSILEMVKKMSDIQTITGVAQPLAPVTSLTSGSTPVAIESVKTEAIDPSKIAEAMKEQIASAVKESVEALQKEHQENINKILEARRKTHLLPETKEEADKMVENATFEDALRCALQEAGIRGLS